jgi:hypothetical protein|tara:strand:+ start:307 stop:690 length:384 start_codon:yes stop_codon:yes gene_type:complete
MAAKKMIYQEFKDKVLVEHLTDAKGKPKHTRFYKNYFYAFRKQLIKDFGKQLDMLYCSKPGCEFENNYMFDGNATVMELDHINRDTSDSRPENLRSLCALHHQQTLGYKNRKSPITEYVNKLINLQR